MEEVVKKDVYIFILIIKSMNVKLIGVNIYAIKIALYLHIEIVKEVIVIKYMDIKEIALV